jgi:phosphatidylserine/phosphatidylglycerophosphate/cardiolipin synthase-like enzyme
MSFLNTVNLPKSTWVRWAIGFGCGLLLFVTISSQFRSSALEPTLPVLPQDAFIQVYFNHSQSATYTDPYRQIARTGDDLEARIIAAIGSAQTSIDVAVHEFTLPGIALALSQRRAAGVKVRIIVENTYSTPIAQRSLSAIAALDNHDRAKAEDLFAFVDINQDGRLSAEEIAQRDALSILAQGSIPVIDDTADGTKGSGLMHHKFMVVDSQTVITGSANWTMSGIHGDFSTPESRGNANSLLVINGAGLAQQFVKEFDLMWGDGPEGSEDSLFGLQKPERPPTMASTPGSVVEVQFSPTSKGQPWPTSVNGLIAKTLGQATQSIDMALFVFSDQPLSNQLMGLAQRGISIKALIDPSFAYQNYSEGLDMLGLSLPDHRCKFEAENLPWANPISTVGLPNLPRGDKLHHKFAVIDHRTVIIGSQNWSKAANHTNDENLLVIQNPTVAAHFEREFERLYEQAELGMTPHLQQKIQERRQQCGL